MIGTVIDQYQITRRLGGGGMGEVFLALDLELDREVAIKCVRPELSDLDEVAARFRAEARTLASLAHVNIATVYRFFANEGQLFLVMEYISGKPFGDMLLEEGSQPAGRVVSLVRQALAGLGYAHQNKIVHRDIKPANLMLDGHDTVKVVDFGIAHLLDQTRITRSGSVLGTPAYMAPEQVLGQPVDQRTDLYALGVVLYEMLTGKLPFKASSQFEIMRAHLEESPRPLADLAGKVSQPLQETVAKALAKDSARRFQTAGDFSEALAAAAGESTAAVSVAVPAASTLALGATDDVSASQWWRSPVYWASGAALAVLAAVLMLIGNDDQVPPGRAEVSVSTPQSETLTQPASGSSNSVPGASDAPIDANLAGVQGQIPVPVAARTEATTETLTQPDVTVATSTVAPAPRTDSEPGMAAATASSPKSPSTSAAAPSPPKSQPAAVVVRKPQQTSPRVTTASYSVRAIKVSVHQRQGTGRFSRAAGYNGAFTLAAPDAAAQPLMVDEYVEVSQNGRQLMRELVGSELRTPGRFGSKARIQGLKKLPLGTYSVRLLFEHKGRRLGMHEWTVQVGK